MREARLLAPTRMGRVHGPAAHDGTITTEVPDQMWGPQDARLGRPHRLPPQPGPHFAVPLAEKGEAASTARICSSRTASLHRGFGPRFWAAAAGVARRACPRYTVDRASSHTRHTRAKPYRRCVEGELSSVMQNSPPAVSENSPPSSPRRGAKCWLETHGQPGRIGPAVTPHEEVAMVRQERWDEIRRLGLVERVAIAELARRFELDRKTVRRCLRDAGWHPYRRAALSETVLTTFAEYLHARHPRSTSQRRSSSRSCASAATRGATKP